MYPIMIITVLALTMSAHAEEASRLQALEHEIKTLARSLAKDETKQESLSEHLKNIDDAIVLTSDKLKQVEAQIQEAEHEIKGLNHEQQLALAALEHHKTKLKYQFRQAYLNQGSSLLKILLNQDDPHEMQRIFHYYRYINTASKTEIKGLQESIASITLRSQVIIDKMTDLKAMQEEQLEQQATLKKEHQKRNTLLASLHKNMAKKENRIKQLKEDARGLNKIIAKIETANQTSPKTAFDARQGGLKWPTEGTLMHAFNTPREGDALKWNGVFISAEEGTKVRAIHKGKVVFADYLRGYGNLIIVDHGDNFMSLYGNNDKILKKLGDELVENESIAIVGKNGTMPISGLYFEIRRSGQPVDPSAWIKKHL